MNTGCANPYKLARQAKGLTQVHSAMKLHVDVRTLQYYETGRRVPPGGTRSAMAELYEAPQLVVDPQSPTSATAVFLKELEDVNDLRRDVMEITYDNVIGPDESEQWDAIRGKVQGLAMACTALGSVR